MQPVEIRDIIGPTWANAEERSDSRASTTPEPRPDPKSKQSKEENVPSEAVRKAPVASISNARKPTGITKTRKTLKPGKEKVDNEKEGEGKTVPSSLFERKAISAGTIVANANGRTTPTEQDIRTVLNVAAGLGGYVGVIRDHLAKQRRENRETK